MKTLIIIPAYNEEGSIVKTVDSLIEKMPAIDYIIINDGSSDGTEMLCKAHGYNVISLSINLGLTGGFQTGMKYAYSNNYDAALQFDADGQHRPDYVQPLIDAMGETNADIVIGSRFAKKDKHLFFRLIGSSLISAMIKITTGKWIQDPTSGMRLYNKKMIEIFATKHDIAPEPDTLAYFIRKGLKTVEVPVKMQERFAGKSYLSVSRSVSYMLRTCISILILQWFR